MDKPVVAQMITPIKSIRSAFDQLAKTRDEFEAVELVARQFGLAPEAVAEIVAMPQEAMA